MTRNALIFGFLLFALGPIFYFLGDPGHQSPTSFIPSIFGVLIAAFGLVARKPTQAKAGMHGAAGVALLGFLGSLRGLSTWPLILTGQTAGLTQSKLMSSWATLLMGVLCLIFVALCGKWFMSNRRARRTAE